MVEVVRIVPELSNLLIANRPAVFTTYKLPELSNAIPLGFAIPALVNSVGVALGPVTLYIELPPPYE